MASSFNKEEGVSAELEKESVMVTSVTEQTR